MNSFLYTEKVYSGTKVIKISSKAALTITSFYAKDCDRETDLCPPSIKFALTNGDKYHYSQLIKFWNGKTFVYEEEFISGA